MNRAKGQEPKDSQDSEPQEQPQGAEQQAQPQGAEQQAQQQGAEQQAQPQGAEQQAQQQGAEQQAQQQGAEQQAQQQGAEQQGQQQGQQNADAQALGQQEDGDYRAGHDATLGDPTQTDVQFKDESLKLQNTGKLTTQEVVERSAQKGFVGESYKEVYQTYEKAAEAVLESDEVPQGYKNYIQKYFDMIRPQ